MSSEENKSIFTLTNALAAYGGYKLLTGDPKPQIRYQEYDGLCLANTSSATPGGSLIPPMGIVTFLILLVIGGIISSYTGYSWLVGCIISVVGYLLIPIILGILILGVLSYGVYNTIKVFSSIYF